MISLLAAMSLIMATNPGELTDAPSPTAGAAASGQVELKRGETRTKMVCRMETPTGSRFAKKVCLSEADHQRRQEDAYQGMRGLQTNAPTCCATSGN